MERIDEAIVALVRQDMQRHLGRGRVADYIPALGRIHPRHFAIAVALCDGRTASAGDAGTAFSVQSISKVFTLTMALEKLGADLWKAGGGASPPAPPSIRSSSSSARTAFPAIR